MDEIMATSNQPTPPRPSMPPTPRPARPGGPIAKPKGNGALIGWIVSGAIVVLLGAGVAIALWASMATSVGEPTEATTAAGRLDAVTIDADITKLVSVPSGGGAEKLYAEAIKTAIGDKENVLAFLEQANNPDPMSDPQLKKVVDLLTQAADTGLSPDVELVFENKALKMKATNDIYVKSFFMSMGHLLTKTAQGAFIDEKLDPAARRETALKYNRVALIYSWRFWKQGVYATYRYPGASVMGDALAQFHVVYKEANDAEKLAVVAELEQARKKGALKWCEKLNICHSLKPNPGDLANMALHDKDRSMRLQGFMWLGVAQWTSAAGSQRAAIQKFLEKYTTDSDKYVSEQARTALDLERGQVQELSAQAGG
jgi:hypothetical protein